MDNIIEQVKKLWVPQMSIWPAASKIHHAYPGGLLEHTEGVVKATTYIAGQYGFNSEELLLAQLGAWVHDVGKLDEYNQDGTKNLIHHIPAGIERLKELDISDGLRAILTDILNTSHGQYGPTEPVTKIQMAIHLADMVDSYMRRIIDEGV